MPEAIGPVMSLVYQYLRPYQEAGLIWKTQTCTYQRETARYGPGAMLLAEELFYADSLAVLTYLRQMSGAEGEDRRCSRQLRAKAAAGGLEVPITEIVSSFIHLHVNRLIPGQQRLHELLLYDFLCRHYKTKLALEKKNSLFFTPDNPLF